ncbi:MAG: DNA primase [Acidobacteriota bacterium]
MGRITPEVVQQVRDAIDIIDIAAQLTSLKKQGRKYVALCPFHKEKTPSFQIDPDLGLYHCFGCGAGGDAIKLHMETSGDDFRTAIESLAHRYAIPLPADDGDYQRPSLDVTGALEAALHFFARELSRVEMPRRYLDERQISPELRQGFGLGYAPDGWHLLLDALRSKVDMKLLVAAGLVGISDRTERPYDRFRHRLMFPIHSTSGRLVGFGGRTLGDDRAKYVNTSETEAFKKGSLLYGLHQAKRSIRDRGRAILVEGYFDVLAMTACGLPESVAGMGTALTPEQAKLISRFTDRVVLAYDGDSAGQGAADKALPILLAAGLAVEKAPFPAGHDPDSLRLEAGPDTVKDLVDTAADALQLTLDTMTGGGNLGPTEQAEAAEQVRKLLGAVKNPITRSAYARTCAQRLGVDEELLLKAQAAELFSRGLREKADGGLRDNNAGERRILQWLLLTEQPLPEANELPLAEAFLNPSLRKLVEAFLELYRLEGSPPTPRDVRDAVADDPDATAELARLLSGPPPEEDKPPQDSLASLESRWFGRRIQQLQAAIQAAQDGRDDDALRALLAEKADLVRRRHPSMSGRFW